MVAVEDFGAIGDGAANDEVAIRAAIRSSTLVEFSAGKTYMARSLDLPAGVTLLGYGATIAQQPAAPNWSRLITTQNTTASAKSSSPARVVGLTLDGNRVQQGEYRAYQKQHCQLIFVMGTNHRFPVEIIDVTCRETPSDGVSIWRDVAAYLRNVKFWNCYRSGLAVTGGGSEVRVEGMQSDGDVHMSALNVEVDGASTTAPLAPLKTDVFINGMSSADPVRRPGADNFGQQFEARDGGVISVTNSTVRGFTWIYTPGSTFRAVGSSFDWDPTFEFGRIQKPGVVTFDSCTHVVHGRATGSHPYIGGVRIIANGAVDGYVAFRGCEWLAGGSTAPIYALSLSADSAVKGNLITVLGGTVGHRAGFAGFARMDQGGTLHLAGLRNLSPQLLQASSTTNYPMDVRVEDIRGVAATSFTAISAGSTVSLPS